MRVLMIDIDTLRPDHLGCYGYERETSPCIDEIAKDGLRFNNYYCSDSPCLPSRAALLTGRFGIHNGIAGHGGTAADIRLTGPSRGMMDQNMMQNLFWQFRRAGMHTASFSSFSERHSAYWFTAGLNEMHNVGKSGNETAADIIPGVLHWMDEHAAQDDWFLHVHLWDPHTPYRTPDDMGNPFQNNPMPSWITPEVFGEHLKHIGPHSLNELYGFESEAPPHWRQQPGSATSYSQAKNLIDLYDCGIRYADYNISKIVSKLKQYNIYDDVIIIVTSDHGENLGELGIYSEHGTADNLTCRIPMIVKWPGMITGHDDSLRYNVDLLPTVAELLGQPQSDLWDGKSYADLLNGQNCDGHNYLVLTQCAHVCQRGVRFGQYYYLRTYHDGMHEFPVEMLFDLQNDFFEQENLAPEKPEICAEACRYLTDWEQQQMLKSHCDVDPLWTVIREGGPYHTLKCDGPKYAERLKETGRSAGAERFRQRHQELFKN